jgi:hypothetical protein
MGSSNPHVDSLAIIVRDLGESFAITLSLLLLGGQLLNDATLLKTLGVLLNESLGDRVMQLGLEQDMIESRGVDGRESKVSLSKLLESLISLRVDSIIVKVTYSGHAWRRHNKLLSRSNGRHGNLRVGGGGDIGRAVLALLPVVLNEGPSPCLGVVFIGHAAGQDLPEIHLATTTFLHGWVLVWIMLEGMV